MIPVRLERVTRADAADLIAANSANQNYHMPWVASFIDQAGFDAWFGRTLAGPNIGFVARHAESARIVGVVNINEIVAGVFQSAYLGYYGMSEFHRRGLMAEALRLAIKYAFDELGLHRLEANIQPENLAFDHAGAQAWFPSGENVAALSAYPWRMARSRAVGIAVRRRN